MLQKYYRCINVYWFDGFASSTQSVSTCVKVCQSVKCDTDLARVRYARLKDEVDTVSQDLKSPCVGWDEMCAVLCECDMCTDGNDARVLLPHWRQPTQRTHTFSYNLFIEELQNSETFNPFMNEWKE